MDKLVRRRELRKEDFPKVEDPFFAEGKVKRALRSWECLHGYVGLAQIPWRLLFAVPSLSVLLVWASLVTDYNPWLMLGLIVASEFIKGGMLMWLLRRQNMQRRFAGG